MKVKILTILLHMFCNAFVVANSQNRHPHERQTIVGTFTNGRHLALDESMRTIVFVTNGLINVYRQGNVSYPDYSLLSASAGGSIVIPNNDNVEALVIGTDTFAVSTSGSEPKVFVYSYDGTVWSHTQTITHPTSSTSTNFGRSMALYRDTLVISATNDEPNYSGSVYIYIKVLGLDTWTLHQRVLGEDRDYLGQDLALYGDLLIATTLKFPGQSSVTSQAYVYQRTNGMWTNVAKISPFSPRQFRRVKVSLHRNVIALQTWDQLETYVNEPVRTHIYRWNGSSPHFEVLFDTMVGFPITTIAVYDNLFVRGYSSFQESRNRNSRRGFVEVFSFTGTNWTHVSTFDCRYPQWQQTFGELISLQGTTLLVGAPKPPMTGFVYDVSRMIATNGPSTSPTLFPIGPPTSSPTITPLSLVPQSLRRTGSTGSIFVQGELTQDEELAFTCRGCDTIAQNIIVSYGPNGDVNMYLAHSIEVIPKYVDGQYDSSVIVFKTAPVADETPDTQAQNLVFNLSVTRIYSHFSDHSYVISTFTFSYPSIAQRQAPQIDHLEGLNCTSEYPRAINCPTDGILRDSSNNVLFVNGCQVLDVLTIWLKNMPVLNTGVTVQVSVTVDGLSCADATYLNNQKTIGNTTVDAVSCVYGSGVSGIGSFQAVIVEITVINSTSTYTRTSLPAKFFNRSRPQIDSISGCSSTLPTTSITDCQRGNTLGRITIRGSDFGSGSATAFIGGEQCAQTQHDFDFPHNVVYCVYPKGRQTDNRVWVMNSKGGVSISNGTMVMSYEQCQPRFHQNLTAIGDFGCYPCSPGTFSAGLNGAFCQSCPAGTFSGSSQSSCTACPSGTVSVQEGSATCSQCSDGFVPNIDSTACVACQPGTFSRSGASQCSFCGLGLVSTQSGSSNCSLCAAGSVPNADSTACLPCQLGTFGRLGDLTCQQCPSGSFSDETGSMNCSTCTSGQIASIDATTCVPCQTGTFSNVSYSSACTECQRGTFVNQVGASSCLECSAGFVQPLTGQAECTRCDASSICPVTGSTVCARCDPNTSPNWNGTLCECDAGFFQIGSKLDSVTNFTLATCFVCSQGMNCSQRALRWDTVLPLPGYMPMLHTEPETTAMVKCINNACVGGHNGFCVKGFTGPVCAECAEGFGRQSANRCERCLPPGLNTMRMIGFFLLAMFLVACFIYKTIQVAEESASDLSIIGKVAFTFLQFNSIALSFDFQFPPSVRSFLTIQQLPAQIVNGVMNVDCSVQHSDSLTAKPIYIKALAYFFLPVFILAICKLTFINFHCSKPSLHEVDRRSSLQPRRGNIKKLMSMDIPESSRAASYLRASNSYVTSVIIILFMIYPSIVQNTFGLFNCKKLGVLPDDLYLIDDMSVHCWKPNHNFWVSVVGVPLMVFYVLGIPFMLFIILFQNRKQLMKRNFRDVNRNVVQRYNFLFKGYDPAYYYWEVLIMIRKVFMVSIAVFFSHNVQIQSLLATFLIVIALVLHAFACPFISDAMDGLELLSLFSSFCTYFFGQFLFVPELSEITKIVFSLAIASMNTLFMLVVLLMFCGNARKSVATFGHSLRYTLTCGKVRNRETRNDQTNNEIESDELDDLKVKALAFGFDETSDDHKPKRHKPIRNSSIFSPHSETELSEC